MNREDRPQQPAAAEDRHDHAVSVRRPRVASLKLLGGISSIVILGLIVASIGLDAMSQFLPAPTGMRGVGRTSLELPESADVAPAADQAESDAHRSVSVSLWYPAEPGVESPTAPYWYANHELPTGAQGYVINRVRTHTLPEAMVAQDSPFPLLLFSPDEGKYGADYTAIIEDLVSHGFIVAAVDHPPRPTVSKSATADKSHTNNVDMNHMRARVRELQETLNCIEQWNSNADSPLAGRIDLGRVGVFGNGIGGITATEFSMVDSRVQATANLNGHVRCLPFVPNAEDRGTRQPFLYITQAAPRLTSERLTEWNMTRTEAEKAVAEARDRSNALLRTIEGGAYRLTLPNATEESFSDVSLRYPGPLEVRHGRTQVIRDYLRGFFEKHLLDYEVPLLDPEILPPSETNIERFVFQERVDSKRRQDRQQTN